MTVPLIILAGLTVAGGLINLPYLTEAAVRTAEAGHGDLRLALEHWLEPSLLSLELSVTETEGVEEALLDIPRTPTAVQYGIAILASVATLTGLGLSMGVVYRRRPETAADPDPLERTPIWWWSILPLNTFYMKGVVPLFNRLSAWLANRLDGEFWHDFFHDRVIRDTFVRISTFLNDIFDTRVVDGAVNGTGRAANWLSGVLRRTQTGYARNYALAVFLGVVMLLAYFLFLAG
jgi:NADH-quinone oxidoreductase subunit L